MMSVVIIEGSTVHALFFYFHANGSTKPGAGTTKHLIREVSKPGFKNSKLAKYVFFFFVKYLIREVIKPGSKSSKLAKCIFFFYQVLVN